MFAPQTMGSTGQFCLTRIEVPRGDGPRFLILTKVDEANAAPLSRPSKLGFADGEKELFVRQRHS
jgi:hypothetical protein